jgi:low affinity Fe/Cu permease
MDELFRRIAKSGSAVLGSAWSFVGAIAIVLLWAVTGPLFHFSDTWQLVINTGTTIVTFLMVFLIQNTQNRDSKALHLKLDELLCAVQEARTGLVGLENLPDADLEELESEFKQAARDEARKEARAEVRSTVRSTTKSTAKQAAREEPAEERLTPRQIRRAARAR